MESGESEPQVDERDPNTHPKVLQNENPAVLTWIFANGTGFLQQYGWFILLAILLLVYLKRRFGSQVENISRRVVEVRENASYDPEVTRQRHEQMDEARRRLQEKFDAEAERYREKQQQKEEQKRQEKIDDWDAHLQGKGYRSKFKPSSEASSTSTGSSKSGGSKKTRYRDNDYSPLTGPGAGVGFRPARRSGGGTRGG